MSARMPRKAFRGPVVLAAVLALAPPARSTAAQQAGGGSVPPADTAAVDTVTAAAPLPRDPAVRVGRLPNGLVYFIRANGRPAARAELRLVVGAGSVLEDEDQRGLAHFVEHMAFNGTRRFEKQALVDWLESIGMRFGPDVNAYTGFDETVYMLTVPTDREGVLDTAFAVLADWAGGIAFDSTEVEKERGVVLEEWRGGRGAFARVRDEQFPVLFAGSRYAERLPIGDPEVLRSFDRGSLVRFYRDWYRPDLMAVVAVGDFDPDAIERRIRDGFEDLETPVDPPARPDLGVPGHAETRISVVTDPELPSSQVAVVWKRPADSLRIHADFRRHMTERLYHSMLNFRFFEITQSSGDPPFLWAGSGAGGFVREVDVHQLSAGVEEDEVVPALERVLMEARRVDRYGFGEAELERARADLLRGFERAWAERNNTESAALAAEYVRAFLEDEAFPGIDYEYALARRYVPGIALAEVNALGDAWISERNRVVLASLPDKEGLEPPSEPELAAAFERAAAAELAAWEDDDADRPLVPSPPEPGEVVAETRIDTLDLVEWRLSNGVRVLLKPTDFKEDQVLVRAWSPGGTSLVSDERWLSGTWAGTIVGQSGVGEHSAVELQKRLAGRAVSIGTGVSELEEALSASASPRDLDVLLPLVWLHFTAPRRDSTAFRSLLARLETVLENRGADPESVWADTLAVTLAQGHPRRRPPTPAMLEEIDLDEALAIYEERFRDAGDFTFVFVGAFEPDSLRPLVERWLGGLPAAGREETWRDVGVERPEGVVRRTVRRGLEPKARTALVFHGPLEYGRENRYLLQSLADVLRIRLRETLREERGGTYGVSVNASAERIPRPRYSLQIGFGADPQRLDDLVHAAWAVLDSVARIGPGAETLAKVKETQRRERETALEENGFWISVLSSYARDGEDFRKILEWDSLVEGLDEEALRGAARRWIDRERFVQVSLLPEGDPGAGDADPGAGDADPGAGHADPGSGATGDGG